MGCKKRLDIKRLGVRHIGKKLCCVDRREYWKSFRIIKRINGCAADAARGYLRESHELLVDLSGRFLSLDLSSSLSYLGNEPSRRGLGTAAKNKNGRTARNVADRDKALGR